MITEQELELALDLRSTIKDLKVVIAKLENVVIAETTNLSGGVSIDSTKVEVNEYTKSLLLRFKEEVIEAYRMKLLETKEKYKNIIESPNATLRRIIEENE